MLVFFIQWCVVLFYIDTVAYVRQTSYITTNKTTSSDILIALGHISCEYKSHLFSSFGFHSYCWVLGLLNSLTLWEMYAVALLLSYDEKIDATLSPVC